MRPTTESTPPEHNSLERGRFSDGQRAFAVRASGEHAPDSFQVYANENAADIVVVVTGLNSDRPKAAWGSAWDTASLEWKRWFEDRAFMVFYNGRVPTIVRAPGGTVSGKASGTAERKIRF
ncbi:hypothetical protein [Glycomyces buryatensis]|uniref:Uncharacterized protein n=1 Tax=Glycomyces buryatensis TaxID=2570927 RepID=A0A4S8PTL9_9ACTN|nr:hypothetical protein [Glycomyces buryatensis]THV33681.1 hypothetical protein FAB82_26470 [Glycomyces buryatensis]